MTCSEPSSALSGSFADTLKQALRYVQFDSQVLFDRLRRSCDDAIQAGRITDREARDMEHRYRDTMNGYTYLVKEDDQ